MANPTMPPSQALSEASTGAEVDDSVSSLQPRPRSRSSAAAEAMPTSDSGQTTPEPEVLQADQATQDLIARIKAECKAKYDEKAAALARWYDDDREQWRVEIRSLASENKQLRHSRAALKASAEEKDRLMFQITRNGAPDPNDPCTLCGRVGRRYAEDVGERKSHQRATNRPAPAIDTEGAPAAEDEEKLVTATKSTGKPWDDSLGTYTLPQKPVPSHNDRKQRRHKAYLRESVGHSPREGNEELLATPLETETIYQTSHLENTMVGALKKGVDDESGEQNQEDFKHQGQGRRTDQGWTDEYPSYHYD